MSQPEYKPPELKLTQGQRVLLCVAGAAFLVTGVIVLQQYSYLNNVTEVYGEGIDPRMLFLVFGLLLIVMGVSAVSTLLRRPPPVGEFSPRKSPRRGYAMFLLIGMIAPLLFVLGSSLVASADAMSLDTIPQLVVLGAVLIGGARLAWMAWSGK